MIRIGSVIRLAVAATIAAAGLVLVPAAPALAAPPLQATLTIKPMHITGQTKCLDVVGGSYANGARIQQWGCNVDPAARHQRFYITNAPGLSGWYQIHPSHSNLCLDLVNFSTADGTQFQQRTCDYPWTQHFRFTSLGGDVYAITGYQSKCADITGVSTADGARLQYWSCLSGYPANQRFLIRRG